MRRTNENRSLDVLRCIAVFFVLVSHVRYFIGWNSEDIYSLETLGRLGVAIFFVHTTLVLLMSLERTGDAFLPFMIRRIFRIYPLSCAVVIFTALVAFIVEGKLDVSRIASNLLLVQNLTGHISSPQPLWSLPYEVQMCFFLPALFAIARMPKSQLRIGLLCTGVLAAGLVSWFSGVDFRLLRYVPCFLPGALAFVLSRHHPRFGPYLLFGVVAIGALTIPALVAAGLPETPLFWVLCLALALAIPHSREIENTPLARAAKVVATYSYGIYLTHIIALGLAFSGSGRGPLNWAIFIAMLPALAFVVYHLIEKPGIALGKLLADRVRSLPMGAATTQ